MPSSAQEIIDTLVNRLKELGNPRADRGEAVTNLQHAITAAEHAANAAPGRYYEKQLYAYIDFSRKTLEQAARQ
jgi:hypothetical protein